MRCVVPCVQFAVCWLALVACRLLIGVGCVCRRSVVDGCWCLRFVVCCVCCVCVVALFAVQRLLIAVFRLLRRLFVFVV